MKRSRKANGSVASLPTAQCRSMCRFPVFDDVNRLVPLLLVTVACGGDLATPPPSPPSVATKLEAVSVLTQRGPAGEPANFPPAARAIAADGSPVSGVVVRFSASGGSVVEPASVATGADGIARALVWRLGAGDSEVEASSEGVASVTFAAASGVRGFDLVVRWLSPPSADAQVAVAAAEAIVEQIIWEDLPDERVVATPVCRIGGVPSAIIDENIDDVMILAQVGPIDGPGGAGAQGFPCLIRDPGTQTIVGFVRFDEAEFSTLDANLKREFALHEMVHALGLVPGIINIATPGGFSRSCLKLPSTGAPNVLVQDSHFDCPNAVAAFDRIGGSSYAGNKVPLENGATTALTANTLNHHWRKSSFKNELMTGWFTVGLPAPLSSVTVGALEDLDYSVTYAAAEPFRFEGAIAGVSAASFGPVVQLTEPGAIPPAEVFGHFAPVGTHRRPRTPH